MVNGPRQAEPDGLAYFDRNIPIVNERLKQASVHLADTLNEVFMKRP